MLLTLSEHQSFTSARRSLLITSCLVILFSGSQIMGDSVNLLGLSLKFSKDNLVFLLRLASAYLLWAFLWTALTEFYPKVKTAIVEQHRKVIELSLEEAKSVDEEISSHGSEYHNYHEDPDAWWEAHFNLRKQKELSIMRLERFEKLTSIARLTVVDILPVLILSFFAVFCPHLLADMLI